MGLAAASIFLFLFFFIRRRRRQQRLEHDAAVASTLAAVGYGRRPLDGDDEEGRKGMRERRGSSPFGMNTTSSLPSVSAHNSLGALSTLPYRDDPTAPMPGRDFDPYAAYAVPPPPMVARRDGYIPARTSSPPPGAARPPPGHGHHHSLSGTSTSSAGHIQRESAGSFEPLLGPFKIGNGGSPPRTPNANHSSGNVSIPPPPPRNPARLSDAGWTNRPILSNPADNALTNNKPITRDSSSSVYSDEADDFVDELTAKFQPALEVCA